MFAELYNKVEALQNHIINSKVLDDFYAIHNDIKNIFECWKKAVDRVIFYGDIFDSICEEIQIKKRPAQP